MKTTPKYVSHLGAAILAVGSSVLMAPVSRAQAPAVMQAAGDSSGASAAPASPASSTASNDTAQRLQDLEKEVNALQQEIAGLKDSETPGFKTAAYAQPQPLNAPAAGEDAPAKISISSLLSGITLSGFGDVYYGYNYNHPVDNTSGLRFFDGPTNGFGFNMAELILDKPTDSSTPDSRLGYHVAAGYGEAAKIVNGSDTVGSAVDGTIGFNDGSNFYIKEAYFDYLWGKNLTITVGKFVTPIGAEVIETNGNWNYSRSILFYYAIPYFHFGANAKYVFSPKFALTGYLVNGWNNTFIQHDAFPTTGQSSGLTYGVSLAWTPNAKWAITENYFAGPIVDAYSSAPKVLTDWKQLSDTVIGYTPNMKWAFQINGDYGFGPRAYDTTVTPATESSSRDWGGAAGYVKYTLSPKSNFALRYEYYDDPQGYTGALLGSGGHVQEFTTDYSYNVTSNLLVRGEYRYDWASQAIFLRGVAGAVTDQNTATLGFIYSFSSADLK
jgi:Putative beta-barrel porin-2, OmpL-like. bbp2